ncbi:MAG: S9 family peptidase [Rhizomicrobium sp.]
MRLTQILAALAICLPAGALAAPLETYGRLPGVENIAISPDGKDIAFATSLDGQRAVAIAALGDNNKIIAAMHTGDEKIRDLSWAGNDNLLITSSTAHTAIGVSGPKQEYYLIQSFKLSTHKLKPLLENIANAMNVVRGNPEVRTMDGHTVVFLTGIDFPSETGVPALYAADLDADRTRLVQQGTQDTEGWTIDESGRVVAVTEYSERSQVWRVRLHDGNSWREVFSTPAPIDLPQIEGIAPDGGGLILALPGEDDRLIKLADGSVVPSPYESDYNMPVDDPVTHRMIGAMREGIAYRYVFFGHADDLAWRSLMTAFDGENVELVSWSDDRQRVVVRVDGPSDGVVYQLVDLDAHKATVLAPIYEGLDPSAVAPVKLIHYRAADGMEIPAYLTLPLGRTPKGLPLVVLAHGGPAYRDSPEFDWWSQALASRGYAVLQPEFRGSTGFGLAHLSAGFGQWGRKMQTDLSDGVRHLAAEGTIDPKRVCIAGASYGGYAALAGATLDRGVYRCAVSVSGLSDLHDMMRWERSRQYRSDSATLRYWTRFMGAEDIDDPRLADISPHLHAAQADIPILLIHGKDDTVVPIAQSEEMDDALRAAGKPVRFVRLEGEDHWLSRSDTRLQMLREMVAFLEANNPPD